MESEKQTQRITYYENILREAEAFFNADRNSALPDDALCIKLDELDKYYGSDDWRQDFADDEAGLLPADLKRGVLSEDAVYDLITDHNKLMARLQRIVLRSLEKSEPRQ